MYTIKYIYKEEFKKFNVKRLIIGVKINSKIRQKGAFIEGVLSDIIDDIIVKHIIPYRNEVSSEGKIGLVFKMRNLSPDLCIEYMNIERLKANIILERLSTIAQSNKTIFLDDIEIQASIFIPIE